MKSDNLQPKKLRAYEVAKIYGVSQSTIWNYAKKGFLSVSRPTPRVTLFDVAECEAFFNRKDSECQQGLQNGLK